MTRRLSGLLAVALWSLSAGAVAAEPEGRSAAKPVVTQAATAASKPHRTGDDATPTIWRETRSGLLVPSQRPSIVKQIELHQNFYDPTRRTPRPVPGQEKPKIISPTEGIGPHEIVLPHPPGDPSKLVLITGSGSNRSIAEALAAHGNFKEARAFYGKANPNENIDRSVPASMRDEAKLILPSGAQRIVKAYVPPPAPKNAFERVRRVYEHFFTTGNMPGTDKVLRNEGDPPVHDRVANEVYDNSGAVYGFYKTVLGRFSIDDKGVPIVSIVHQKEMDENGNLKVMHNAYYRDEDRFMRYGEGDARMPYSFTKLSIAGHELTHGVTAHTSGLVYKKESGALNESFSDVLGMAIQQWKQGVSVHEADWRLGTDGPSLLAPAHIGAIRSMSNPHEMHQPAHMSEFKNVESDSGGVHTNSGIPNRAFYGAAMRIGGYVWEKSAKIWYVALRDELRPDATFQDAARATVHVAGELYGEGSREQAAVIAGWKDVGIEVKAGELPPPRDPPPPPTPPTEANKK